MRHRRHTSGVTLIEVLISIVILGLGIVAAVESMSAALLTTQHANRMALATTLAQSAIEDLRGTSDIVSYEEALDNPQLINGHITVTATGTTLRKVTVDVTWTGRHARTERVRLETMIAIRSRHTGG